MAQQPPRSMTAPIAEAVSDPDSEIAAAAFMDSAALFNAAESSTNPTELDALSKVVIHRKDTDAAMAVMSNPRTASRSLGAIVESIGWADPGLREAQAVHPNADLDSLCETMFQVEEDHMSRQIWEQSFMQALAERPGLDQHMASWVADDSDPWVRQKLARNADCPPEILTVLAGDEDGRVTGSVVSNPNAPPAALIIAAKSVPTSSFWRYVLERGDCPPEVLTELAYHGESDMRIAAVAHANMPAATVAALRSDSDPTVRRAAWKAQASAG